MQQPTDLAAALKSLQTVIDRWDDLEASRIKGTKRPHLSGQRTLTRQAADRRNAQRLEDIANADDRAPGYTEAPLHLDVLDIMSGLLMSADLLHERVAQDVGEDRLDHPASAYDDPAPYVAYVLKHLPAATQLVQEYAAEQAALMESAILLALGEVFDGQQLDAVCPFCMGRANGMMFGEITLHIRLIPSTANPEHVDFAVVCENPNGCTPFANEVDVWLWGRPAWRFQRWAWLADRLIRRPAA